MYQETYILLPVSGQEFEIGRSLTGGPTAEGLKMKEPVSYVCEQALYWKMSVKSTSESSTKTIHYLWLGVKIIWILGNNLISMDPDGSKEIYEILEKNICQPVEY